MIAIWLQSALHPLEYWDLGIVSPHLIADPLVGLKVKRELGVVPLDDDLGGLLDGLSSDTTHVGDFRCACGKEAVEGREGRWLSS